MVRNGVDTHRLFATLDLLTSRPELGRFRLRASNRWIDGTHNRSTIHGFHGAGGEDTSRAAPFELDAGAPAVLLGTDTGATPAEHLLHALAADLTTAIVYVAAARRVELASVDSDVVGDIDLRGCLGLDGEPASGSERVAVTLRIAGDAPEAVLRAIAEHAAAHSPVHDMLRCGVHVAVDVTAG
jgi:uncharacterized OsmC-like protein